MKKLLTISIAFLYLAMTAGMVVSAHYCMGDLADVSLGHNTAEKCSDCGMDNSGCCHDDVKVFRITDAHGPASGLAINKISVAQAILPSAYSAVTDHRLQPVLTIATIPDPPDQSGTSFCILHSVFRI